MRLFIGCPVPATPEFTRVTRDLQRTAKIRPVPPGSWHVTLRFLGEVRDGGAVVQALSTLRHPVMPVQVRGVGAFLSPAKAKVAWAAVQAEGIQELHQKVAAATAEFGEPPEARPFVPHATLARLDRPTDLRPWVEAHQDALLAAGVLRELVLYRSELTRQGAIHVREAVFPLLAPA